MAALKIAFLVPLSGTTAQNARRPKHGAAGDGTRAKVVTTLARGDRMYENRLAHGRNPDAGVGGVRQEHRHRLGTRSCLN
jgi:hypothetical protein